MPGSDCGEEFKVFYIGKEIRKVTEVVIVDLTKIQL